MIGIIDLAVAPVVFDRGCLPAPELPELLDGMDLAGVDSCELEPLGMAHTPWLVYLHPTADVLLLDPVESAGDRVLFLVQGALARLDRHPRYRRLADELRRDPSLRARLLSAGFSEKDGLILPRVVISGHSGESAAADDE